MLLKLCPSHLPFRDFSLSPGPVRFLAQEAQSERGVWLAVFSVLRGCPSSAPHFSCHSSVVLSGKEEGLGGKGKWLSWAPSQSAVSGCYFFRQVPAACCVTGSKHLLSLRAVRCLPSDSRLIPFKPHLLTSPAQPPASRC